MAMRPPLPPRDGLHAIWVRTPDRDVAGSSAATLADFLIERLGPDLPVAEMLAAGEFVFANGAEVSGNEPYRPNTFIWFHRILPPEPDGAWDLPILYRDDRIVVVDKPGGLPTIPRGQQLAQTAVVLLRRRLELPDLSPMHRLDRLTAGVLLFTTEQRWRRAYQTVFEQRQVAKLYEAIAPLRADLELPRVVRSHIQKRRGELQAIEVPGEPPNAETHLELIECSGSHGRYRLRPTTGRTHQLRVQLNGLGIPICGDPLYPKAKATLTGDLQLVAREVSFSDPVDHSERHFASARALVWPN